MADEMMHRGPDGEGFHVEPYGIIGMRRLSIIDISGGWQPLYNEDRSVVVVANGEIYNFVELRAELAKRGHVLATGSDCETIVHLYEEFGEDCVHQLRGMFAFALIDRNRRRLLIARDRMGEKPLVYHQSPESLFFCSELTGLVASGAVEAKLCPDAAKSYFHWQFVPEPATAITGASKLDSGCLLSMDLRTGRSQIRRYWRLSDAPAVYDDPVERVRHEIEEVGRLTSRSDVPMSVGLSGGIDSSAIAALAQRYSSQPVCAISIGYEGITWQDERSLAREFAADIRMPLIERRIAVSDVVDRFAEMCIRRDDPVNDISGSSFDLLYRASHEAGCKVMLGGHGGDELFWGYPWYRSSRAQTVRKRLMLAGRAGLASYLTPTGPPLSASGVIDWLLGGAGLIRGLGEYRRDRATPAERVVFWDLRDEFRNAQRRFGLIAGEAVRSRSHDPAALFDQTNGHRELDVFLTQLMCDTFLQSNGMILCDRLSMAAEVEGRLPLVDYRLAEVVVGLRKHNTDGGLGHKYWLIEALRGLVPEYVFRRRKRGFTPPWRQWIRAIRNAYAGDLSNGELVRQGILSPKGVRALSPATNLLGQQIPFAMSALVLEQWARGMRKVQSRSSLYRTPERASADPLLPQRNVPPSSAVSL
jgi:asparagine synthase (glutamine-hydrolysing)